MQRVMIVGQPGSGKSTLARGLGKVTGLPVVHVDHIHWMPRCRERQRDEKTLLCHAVEAGEASIFTARRCRSGGLSGAHGKPRVRGFNGCGTALRKGSGWCG
ncbi:hypothetical protein [Pseudotabrizicola sediminis]|uniref:hypothetical protein n=1 Tax=Pseudotabrizicola sediminis TaxID=2486418 RepID=UPI001FD9F930|nr:hypothetical protein [Pseudotabrizicola sediminis]